MGKQKKAPDASLKGKRPVNKATSAVKSRSHFNNPGHIKNKLKRSEVYGKYLLEKKARKKQQRLQREKEADELGADVSTVKQTPRTLDNAREVEETLVQPHDEEVMGDEATDEFADYFSDTVRPKIIITTRPRPSAKLFHFVADLMKFIPNLFYYPRKSYSVKEICEFASTKDFTHLIVLTEKSKVCNGMIISHLRLTGSAASDAEKGKNVLDGKQVLKSVGPTAFFKVSNVITSNDVPNHGASTSHVPELVLNGFSTRLGHRVGRLLGSIFPHNAQFQGRQVATFHNQRDYIFVRHHRYIFKESKEDIVEEKPVTENTKEEDASDDEDEETRNQSTKKKKPKKKTMARLQELGPRFTLKLRWIQEGVFDTQFGEYEWIHKRKEMDTSRRKFHL